MRAPLQSAYDRYFTSRRSEHLRLFSGIYPDFRSAMQAIPASRLVGYDNVPSARRMANELFRIYNMDYPVIFWLSRLLAGCRSLFDWGGNIGVSYFAFRRLLHYPPDLEWIVNDVPAVVEEGLRNAQKHQAPGLLFTTSLAALNTSDILLAAGSLHFIEHPFDILRKQPAFRTSCSIRCRYIRCRPPLLCKTWERHCCRTTYSMKRRSWANFLRLDTE